jgi:hypothetical protein
MIARTDVRRASLPVSATRIAELKLGTVIVHPALVSMFFCGRVPTEQPAAATDGSAPVRAT